MNNLEDDLELQMCGGCGRRFERRAALNSHSQICQKRIAVQNNIKACRRSPSTSAVTTSGRITSTKVLPTVDRHPSRTENSKNDITYVEGNANTLTPLSVLAESMQSNASGIKGSESLSSSPVPLDISNQLLTSSGTSYHRSHHCSDSRADTIKKDIPEKRIEIQIRRDYCKTGRGVGAVSTVLGVGSPLSQQQDCNSEINGNSMPCDDTEEGNNSFNEDCESHSRLYQLTEPGRRISRKDSNLSCGKLEGSNGINVCSFAESVDKETVKMKEETMAVAHIHPVPEVRNVNSDVSSIQSVQKFGLASNTSQSGEYSDATEKKSVDTHLSNFMIFTEKNSTAMRQESDSRIRQVFTDPAALSDGNELQEEVKKAVNKQGNESASSAKTKKEEQFSPIMENRMQSMINIRRLQCLPCQKKFNKLTNLRRHVAVHIGWNRYRCTECTFKCFSKYDCVAHVNKMHLGKGKHEKAQTMVEYIETQISDMEYDTSKHEPTEEVTQSQSDERRQSIMQVTHINLNDKYGVSEDTEVTANDAICCSVPDVDFEAIPNDTQNSLIEVEDDGSDLYVCAVEEERADDVTTDVPSRQDSVITAGSITNTATVKMKEGYVNKTVVTDTATILQADEASTDTLSTSLKLEPKKHYMSTEYYGDEELKAVPSKKLLTTTEYQQNIDKVAVLGKSQ
jgi:hypothetical protein